MNHSRYKQGIFKPINKSKWITTSGPICYKSSWELHFMNWLDTNKSVLKCSSEEVIIHYKYDIDRKKHRYFPDFYAAIKDNDGKITEYIFEIKPYIQTQAPKPPKRQNKNFKDSIDTFIKNSNKWAAAEKHCSSLRKKGRNIYFQIITERELGLDKKKGFGVNKKKVKGLGAKSKK